jgi:hypothetical protein
MGDPESGYRSAWISNSAAVEPPRPPRSGPGVWPGAWPGPQPGVPVDARLDGSPGVRRYRRLTGLSGILLFACMFLPAVEGCREPLMPYEVPPFVPPYLYGLIFALVAMARRPGSLQLGYAALRVLGGLVVLGSIIVVVVAPPIGLVELIIGTVLLVTVAPAGGMEPRMAATGIGVSVVCILWFGAWSTTDEALAGVHLSLVSSLGLLVGSVGWGRALASRPAIDMPRAAAIERG